jgi:hypothetical protein
VLSDSDSDAGSRKKAKTSKSGSASPRSDVDVGEAEGAKAVEEGGELAEATEGAAAAPVLPEVSDSDSDEGVQDGGRRWVGGIY